MSDGISYSFSASLVVAIILSLRQILNSFYDDANSGMWGHELVMAIMYGNCCLTHTCRENANSRALQPASSSPQSWESLE